MRPLGALAQERSMKEKPGKSIAPKLPSGPLGIGSRRSEEIPQSHSQRRAKQAEERLRVLRSNDLVSLATGSRESLPHSERALAKPEAPTGARVDPGGRTSGLSGNAGLIGQEACESLLCLPQADEERGNRTVLRTQSSSRHGWRSRPAGVGLFEGK